MGKVNKQYGILCIARCRCFDSSFLISTFFLHGVTVHGVMGCQNLLWLHVESEVHLIRAAQVIISRQVMTTTSPELLDDKILKELAV